MCSELSKYPATYFQAHKYGRDPQREAMYTQERRRVEQHIASGRILDVGCGLGGFLAGFSDARWSKFGVEISPFAARMARLHGLQVQDYPVAYSYPDAYFDAVVFRGTIQHINNPFTVLQTCTRLLRRGGWMIFLATPNTNSPVYQRFHDLPALDPERNWLLPSDTMLANILTNLGYGAIETIYPYLSTPYARPVRDAWRYLLRRLGLSSKPFAWPGNMLECYAQKH